MAYRHYLWVVAIAWHACSYTQKCNAVVTPAFRMLGHIPLYKPSSVSSRAVRHKQSSKPEHVKSCENHKKLNIKHNFLCTSVNVRYTYMKISCCVFKQAPCHEDIWGSRDTTPPFWTLALERGEWSASCPEHITTRKKATGTHCRGGWVGPTASLDSVLNRKITCPCQESNSSAIQPVAHCYTSGAIPTLIKYT
jgi:hypothetical protein